VARTPFSVEILTPEGEVFNEEVEMLSTRTTTGSIGVLANHTPLLAMLEPTELRLYRSESDVVRYAQGEGYLQVGGNRAMLLLEEAHPPGELDVALLRERLQKAEDAAAKAEDGSEEKRRALRDKRRWETFLAIAESG
jgi:F-type H+-transporting ATPase subunit epsilon